MKMEKIEKKMLKKINKMEQTGKLILELSMPIEVEQYNGENYLLIIKDADEMCHFFKKDGSYDGYDRPCEMK